MKHPLSRYTFLAGCQLATSAEVIKGIYVHTNGEPCKDCAMKPCRLEKWLQKTKPTAGPPLRTNADLAAEHGITKRQVAKRRIPGTNLLQEVGE